MRWAMRADAMGCEGGTIHGRHLPQVTLRNDTYLKQHDAPEDIEDYHHHLCGRTMMAKTVLDLLHSLGVEDQDIRFDNFGG